MKNQLFLGVSCCFIGTYNFWSFYKQDKLYTYNLSFYISVVLIGIVFLYKACSNLPEQSQKALIRQGNTLNKNTQTSLTNDSIQLEEISSFSGKFQKIANHLLPQMQSEYSISRIFLIQNNRIKLRFKQYQNSLSETFKCEGLQGPANTNFNFHGTKKACASQLCSISQWANCPLCGILKNGFQIKFSGKGPSTDLRFGKGIYFSPDIKKALSYSNCEGKIWILMTKVVMGRVYFAKDSESHLEEFNENKYHCIFGDPRVSFDLQKPEICVMKEEACWPKYLLELEKK